MSGDIEDIEEFEERTPLQEAESVIGSLRAELSKAREENERLREISNRMWSVMPETRISWFTDADKKLLTPPTGEI